MNRLQTALKVTSSCCFMSEASSSPITHAHTAVSLCSKHEPPRRGRRILKSLAITVHKLHRETYESHGVGNTCFARYANLIPVYVLKTRNGTGRLLVDQRHTCVHITHSANTAIDTWKYSNRISCHTQRRAKENVLNIGLQSTAGTVCTEWLDGVKFYFLPTQCIYVFCVDLRTNSV